MAHFRSPDTPEAKRARDKIFPISLAEGLDRLKESTVIGSERQSYDHDVLTGNGVDWLGYLFCDARVEEPLVQALAKTATLEYRNMYRCRLGDLVIPVDGTDCGTGRWIAFEADKYAIIPLPKFQD